MSKKRHGKKKRWPRSLRGIRSERLGKLLGEVLPSSAGIGSDRSAPPDRRHAGAPRTEQTLTEVR